MEQNLIAQGKRLKEVLMHFKLSQKRFGAEIGYHQGYISELIHGIKPISQRILNIIAKQYNVSIDWLLKGHGPMLDPAKSLLLPDGSHPDSQKMEMMQGVIKLFSYYEKQNAEIQERLEAIERRLNKLEK